VFTARYGLNFYYKLLVNFCVYGRAMAQAVSCRPLTRFRRRLVHVRFAVDKVALGQGFIGIVRFSRQYHYTSHTTFRTTNNESDWLFQSAEIECYSGKNN
jgi:hypothetical protein